MNNEFLDYCVLKEKYDARAEELVKEFGSGHSLWANEWYLDDDKKTVSINYSYSCCGESDTDSLTLPIEYMDLSFDIYKEAERLRKIKEKQEEERRIAEEAARKKAEELKAIEKERKEKALYEKLKAKYEGK